MDCLLIADMIQYFPPVLYMITTVIAITIIHLYQRFRAVALVSSFFGYATMVSHHTLAVIPSPTSVGKYLFLDKKDF